MLALALQHDAIIDDEVISDLLAVELGHDHMHPAANDPLYPHVRTLAVAPLRPVSAPALRLYEEYDPYGTSAYRAVSSMIEVSAKRYRYTGKERDEETGLDHMGARYYAGWLARGNPVGMRDPSGTAARPQVTGADKYAREAVLVDENEQPVTGPDTLVLERRLASTCAVPSAEPKVSCAGRSRAGAHCARCREHREASARGRRS